MPSNHPHINVAINSLDEDADDDDSDDDDDNYDEVQGTEEV